MSPEKRMVKKGIDPFKNNIFSNGFMGPFWMDVLNVP